MKDKKIKITNIYKFSIINLFLIAFLGLFSCESDDICTNPAPTPRLILRVQDKDRPLQHKLVNNLLVFGKDNSKVILNASTDSIVIPLKMFENETTFVFVKDAVVDSDGNITSGDTTELKVTYTPENLFIDKGCGYGFIFKNLQVSVSNSSWITRTNVINNTIQDERKASVHIFY
ncbi:MAG: DUF6452 family protein [Capnocytophaga sp.]|nr:DUF6452 family protein [Capnocytophaga sp.]